MTDFHELYARYARDVHRFALYLSCDPALADDITSETFLRAWSSATPIREATVKAYLFTIVRNLYLQERRRSARHVELSQSMPSNAAGQDTRVEHQGALTAVLRALRVLPEVDRAAAAVREQAAKSTMLLGGLTAGPSADHEKETFQRVRRFNRRRASLLGVSIAATLMPLAFGFEGGHIRWLMLRDNPNQALLFGIVALGCWIAHYLMGRRLTTVAQ